MTATVIPATTPTDSTHLPVLEGPSELIEEYLALVAERRAVDERLGFVRAELELFAAAALNDGAPRARFVGQGGAIAARLQATCVFDRANVARELQRMGKLADVAILQGPGLARYLAKEPQVSARLGNMVRMRRSIVLTAADL
ncbi:MAG TPA: hypothetical protein VM370_11825 [Candidatus Thermoplasmatota archaeon]|nr:hypothetical protein [Candidatus Thermoplasmatota archaeon]